MFEAITEERSSADRIGRLPIELPIVVEQRHQCVQISDSSLANDQQRTPAAVYQSDGERNGYNMFTKLGRSVLDLEAVVDRFTP